MKEEYRQTIQRIIYGITNTGNSSWDLHHKKEAIEQLYKLILTAVSEAEGRTERARK